MVQDRPEWSRIVQNSPESSRMHKTTSESSPGGKNQGELIYFFMPDSILPSKMVRIGFPRSKIEVFRFYKKLKKSKF